MIAPLDAPNVFGLYDQSGKWGYIVVFASKRGIPHEEIMDDELPQIPTTNQFLESVRRRIEKYPPTAHAAILEMDGSEDGNPKQ